VQVVAVADAQHGQLSYCFLLASGAAPPLGVA
jgi:hypothetical protein